MKMRISLYNEAGAHLNGRLTLKASAAVERGDAVKFAASTDAAIGVALDGAAAGEIVAVAALGNFTGTVVLKAKGAIPLGSHVTAVGTAAESGDASIGVALGAAAADGDFIEIAHRIPAVVG